MPNSTAGEILYDGDLWNSFQHSQQLWSDPKSLTPSFFIQTDLPVVNKRMLDALKDYAYKRKTDVRICLHKSPTDNFQNMIILHRNSEYYRPHIHSKNGESYQLIEGELGIFFFDGTGNIIDQLRLTFNDQIVARIPTKICHAIFPISNQVIFHESKLGPFIPGEDIIFPEWAPDLKNYNDIKTYKDTLKKACN